MSLPVAVLVTTSTGSPAVAVRGEEQLQRAQGPQPRPHRTAPAGARGWKRFRTIDWPLLAPSLTVNVTLSTIGSLRVFDLPFIMTDGGPANSPRKP